FQVVRAVEKAATQQKTRHAQRTINGLAVIDQLRGKHHLGLWLTVAALGSEEESAAVIRQIAGRVERVRRTLARRPPVDMREVGIEARRAVLPKHARVTQDATGAEVVKQALDQTCSAAFLLGSAHTPTARMPRQRQSRVRPDRSPRRHDARDAARCSPAPADATHRPRASSGLLCGTASASPATARSMAGATFAKTIETATPARPGP
nr:hypothetical protein [Tanacetum cinerariifolium]